VKNQFWPLLLLMIMLLLLTLLFTP